MSHETIEHARATLPVEYGHSIVEENGRRVLVVRVPGAKADYLKALREVALYVDIEEVRDVHDVLLIGSEKVTRLDPIALRDHIREQRKRDESIASDLRSRLTREFGHTLVDDEDGKHRPAVAIRVPRASLEDIAPEDILAIRDHLQRILADRLRDVECAYIVADENFERLGRRVFIELVDPESAHDAHAPVDAKAALRQASREAHAPVDEEPHHAPEAPRRPAYVPKPEYEIITRTSKTAPAPVAKPTPATAPARPQPAPAQAPARPHVVSSKEGEYDIITRPRAPEAAPAPVSAPQPAPVSAASDDDEYEILSSVRTREEPRASEPEPEHAPVAPMKTSEYEIMSSRRAPEAARVPEPAPRARAPIEPVGPKSPVMRDGPSFVPGFVQTEKDDDIEVYVRKTPELPRDIAMPRSAPRAAAHATPAAVQSEDAYEIASNKNADSPLQSTSQGPIGDNGGDVEVTLGSESAIDQLIRREDVEADAEARAKRHVFEPQPPGGPDFDVLATRLTGLGYEIVRDVPVGDNVFDIAAHMDGGKRLLAMNVAGFRADEQGVYADIADKLDADVLIVVTNNLAPGARLATWGTRVQVFRPAELIEVGL